MGHVSPVRITPLWLGRYTGWLGRYTDLCPVSSRPTHYVRLTCLGFRRPRGQQGCGHNDIGRYVVDRWRDGVRCRCRCRRVRRRVRVNAVTVPAPVPIPVPAACPCPCSGHGCACQGPERLRPQARTVTCCTIRTINHILSIFPGCSHYNLF